MDPWILSSHVLRKCSGSFLPLAGKRPRSTNNYKLDPSTVPTSHHETRQPDQTQLRYRVALPSQQIPIARQEPREFGSFHPAATRLGSLEGHSAQHSLHPRSWNQAGDASVCQSRVRQTSQRHRPGTHSIPHLCTSLFCQRPTPIADMAS